MNILLVLIPVTLVVIGIAVAVFFWAVNHQQFDDLDSPGMLPLMEDPAPGAPAAPASPTVDAADAVSTTGAADARSATAQARTPSPEAPPGPRPLPPR